jgi:hypothetical protein
MPPIGFQSIQIIIRRGILPAEKGRIIGAAYTFLKYIDEYDGIQKSRINPSGQFNKPAIPGC